MSNTKSKQIVSRKKLVENDVKKIQKVYPKVVRDSYSNGSVKEDLNHGAKAKGHSGRILGAVASKMRYQRDIKDYNIEQLKITATPLLECMLKHNNNKKDTYEIIYKYLNRSFTSVWSSTEFMCGTKCIEAEKVRKTGKKKGESYKYWGRPDKEDRAGLPAYEATIKKDTENPPYFKKRYLCKDLKIGMNKQIKNKDFQKQLDGNNAILQYFNY
jgi:hypothetical protein